MNNDLTRRLTHGAMMIALFSILLAISVYVPLLNLITALFVPLPLVWYSAKYNRSSSISVTAAAIVIAFLIGGLAALPLALIQAPAGLVMGDAIRTKKSKLYMLMSTGLTLLLGIALQYLAMVKLFNVNIVAELMSQVRAIFRESLAVMDQLGRLDQKTEQAAGDLLILIEASIPGTVMLSAFLTAFIYTLLYTPILNRLGVKVPKFSRFMEMKLPKSVLWYYLLVLLAMFTDPEPGTFLFMVIINAHIVLRSLLFLQGIAFIHFVIHEQGWPKWVTVVATIFAFPLQTFVVMLGIFDLGFNIRGFVSNSTRK